jgi:hypothetical protein
VEPVEHLLPPVWGHDYGGETFMIYAQTDVMSVTVPVERGGCGSSHEVNRDNVSGPGTLTCPVCEPHIIGLNTGWGRAPHEVKLTPDEIAEAEARENVAKREQARTWSDPLAFADTMAKALRSDLPSSAPSLLAQYAALSAEERAAFAALITATAPAIEAPATQPTGDEEDDGAEPSPAMRRGPGRRRY